MKKIASNSISIQYDVLICTYNGEKYIEEQLSSILSQSILPVNILVSDDGSSDATLEKCLDCFKKFSFTRYQFIDGPGRGPKNNFLHGVKFSQSDYLFFSDQDDVWPSNKVAVFIDSFSGTSSDCPGLFFSDAYVVDAELNILHDSFLRQSGLNVNVLNDDSILFENCVQGASICINRSLRELLIKSLDYIDKDAIHMHDWWLAILAKYFGVIVFIDQSLLYYRQHGGNHIGAYKRKGFISDIFLLMSKVRRFKSYNLQADQLVRLLKHRDFNLNSRGNASGDFIFSNVSIIKKLFINY